MWELYHILRLLGVGLCLRSFSPMFHESLAATTDMKFFLHFLLQF